MNDVTGNEVLVVEDPVELVCNELSSSFSVAASAGCGKTHILVSRALALVEKGIPIERLLLLTFTDNAAREMRTRLSLELGKSNQKWAINALDKLPYSSIQTINSFAFEIVAGNFMNAGLSSQPTIVDDIEFEKNLNVSFSKTYNQWANADENSSFFAIANLLGISRTRIFEMIKPLQPLLPISADKTEKTIKDFVIPLKQKIDALDTCCRPAIKRIIEQYSDIDTSKLNSEAKKRLNAIFQLCENCIKSEGVEEFFADFYEQSSKITPTRLSIERRSEFEDLEDAFDTIREQIEETLPKIINDILSCTTALLWNFLIDNRDARFQTGEITHDECLTLASFILHQDSSRYDIWKKYSSVLIDEFQDTDDTQIQLVTALSENEDDSDIGRLFVVGDAKQSIYAFRGAQVDSYEEFVQTSKVKQIALDKSFRSSNLVLDPINKIMSQLLPSYRDMATTRTETLNPGSLNDRVAIIGSQMNKSVEQIREIRAEDVANSIYSFLNRPIEDKKGIRSTNFSDFAILIRDKNGINEVVESLQAKDIPLKVDSVDLLWDLTFTKMTLTLLSAISEPSDSISIVGALKSPYFGCDNNDLILHVRKCKEQGISSNSIWNYESIDLNSESKVMRSLSILRNWHRCYSTRFPSQLLTTLHYEYSLADNFLTLGKSNTESISNYLIALAVNFEEVSKNRTLSDFVAYLNTIKEKGKTPVVYHPSIGEDAVSIMTIHKSKGLEFPVVYVLPSISASNNAEIFAFNSNDTSPLDPSDILYHLNKKISSSKALEFVDAKKEQIAKEEARLLYVAMTRARDYLILCTHAKEIKKPVSEIPKGGVSMLRYAIDKSGIAETLAPIVTDSQKTPISNKVPPKTTSEIISYSEIEEFRAIIDSKKTLNPSHLDENEQTILNTSEISSFIKITKPNRSYLVGNAVHRVLNIVSFDEKPREIKLTADKCALREGIPDQSEEIFKLASTALSNDIITKSKNHLREVPVSGTISGRLVEGYIDLLVETDKGWVIVDYKTDVVESKIALNEKIKKYENQLKTYAFLVSKSQNIQVSGAALLFLRAKGDGLIFVEDPLNISGFSIENSTF